MTIDDFIARFRDTVEGMQTVPLSGGTDFRALPNWDSLAVLATIAMADAEYGVVLTAREIQDCGTLAELASVVMRHRGES